MAARSPLLSLLLPLLIAAPVSAGDPPVNVVARTIDNIEDRFFVLRGQSIRIPGPSVWQRDTTAAQGLNRIGSPVPFIRRDVMTLNEQDRQDLNTAIRLYLTDAVVDAHAANVSHEAERLFTHHDNYILGLELFLQSRRAYRLLPLPFWRAGGPIPPEFMQPEPRDDGTPRNRVPLTPEMFGIVASKPARFELPELCTFETDAELARAVDGWHGGVHGTLGGCFGEFANASASPLFWLWHAYVSQIREQWKLCGRMPSSMSVGARPRQR